jgi:hypothetical protein
MRHIANNVRMLTLALSLTSLAGLVGCGADLDPGSPEVESTTAALNNGSGAAAAFTCDDGANTCTCVGDDDCNDMFGSGLCGSTATCDTSNPSRPVCTCTQAARVVKGRIGAVKLTQAATLAVTR